MRWAKDRIRWRVFCARLVSTAPIRLCSVRDARTCRSDNKQPNRRPRPLARQAVSRFPHFARRVAACVFAAAALASSCAGAQVMEPQAVRMPVTDPSLVKEGNVFRLHEAVRRGSLENWPAQFSGVLAKIKAADADVLADEYIHAYDGVRSTRITMDVIQAFSRGARSKVASALASARNAVTLPDGTRHVLPVSEAYVTHLAVMRAIALVLTERDAPPNISGGYVARVEGACPFGAGPLRLVQKDFAVEGTRDGLLLLAAAVGRTRTTFVGEEVRYIAWTSSGGRIERASVPDRPSEVYRADLGQAELTLTGTDSRTCSIVLRPAE